MAPENEQSGYRRVDGVGMNDSESFDIDEQISRFKQICDSTHSSLGILEEEFCNLINSDNRSDKQSEIEAKEKDEAFKYFYLRTDDFRNPNYPEESVFGEFVSDDDIQKYKATKTNGNYGIKEMGKYLNKNVGKIVIWKMDQLAFTNMFSVGEFLKNEIDSACDYAKITNGRVLYHIISYENSGSLWAGSEAKNPALVAAGPSQLMDGWFTNDWNQGLSDDELGETKNFFRVIAPHPKSKKPYYYYDGRFDPVANLEFGARVLRDGLEDYGITHVDFAVLAHNQGGTAGTVLKEWAKKTLNVDFNFFRKEIYKKMSRPRPAIYSAFLDYLAEKRGGKVVTVAEILRDKKLCDKYFTTDNGGYGYISKILAIEEISKDPNKYGIEVKRNPKNDSFPAVVSDEWKSEYQWDDLFVEGNLSKGMSLRSYAFTSKIDLNLLVFLNQQIRDPDYVFDVDIRLWLPKAGTPIEYIERYKVDGAKVLKHLMNLKKDYLDACKASGKNPSSKTTNQQKSAPNQKPAPKPTPKPKKKTPKKKPNGRR